MTNPLPEKEAAGRGTAAAAPRSHWWVPALAFLGGLVVGIVVVALLNLSTPDFGAGYGRGGAGSSETARPTAPAEVPVAARAEVNEACLRVINEAQDVYVIVSGISQVDTDVDLQLLDDLVRQLQPIEPRLARDLADCRVDTELGGPDVGRTPAPTSAAPSPSATR